MPVLNGIGCNLQTSTTGRVLPKNEEHLRTFPELARPQSDTHEPATASLLSLFKKSTTKTMKSFSHLIQPPPDLDRTISCYIPLLPESTNFKIGYHFVPPFPEDANFEARVFFNGTHIVSVEIKPQQQPRGLISRTIAEAGASNHNNEPTHHHAYTFEFTAVKPSRFKSPAEDGGLIEMNWHRIEGCTTVEPENLQPSKSLKNKFQIGFRAAGEVVGVVHRKHMLIDPVEKPYANFKFYYRTAQSLVDNQIMLSKDHNFTTSNLSVIGESGSLLYHFNGIEEQGRRQRRRRSFSGSLALNTMDSSRVTENSCSIGLASSSSATGSVIQHDISGAAQGPRRHKSYHGLTRRPKRSSNGLLMPPNGVDRQSMASIIPSLIHSIDRLGGDPGQAVMGVAQAVLLPVPGTQSRNSDNGRHTGLSGQFAELRAHDESTSVLGCFSDLETEISVAAGRPRRATEIYQHANVDLSLYSRGLSSSPIEDESASAFSAIDDGFVPSGLAPPPRAHMSPPAATPTTPEQTFTSMIAQTPGSPPYGVSYPVMTPGSLNLPVIEPGDSSDLSPEKATEVDDAFDTVAHSSPAKAVAPSQSPDMAAEKNVSPEKEAASDYPSGGVKSSPFFPLQGSRLMGPNSLSIPRQRRNDVGGLDSGRIPSSSQLADGGGLRLDGHVQHRVTELGSEKDPLSTRAASLSTPKRVAIRSTFVGGAQRQLQSRGMLRSPSRTDRIMSTVKDGLCSLGRQVGSIKENGKGKAWAQRSGEKEGEERRSPGSGGKKITKPRPNISKSLKKSLKDGEDDVFGTSGAEVDDGGARERAASQDSSVGPFRIGRLPALAQRARSGSDRVENQIHQPKSEYSVSGAAGKGKTASADGSQNATTTNGMLRAAASSGGVYVGNSSAAIERATALDDVDAASMTPGTAALLGLAAFLETLQTNERDISEKLATAAKSKEQTGDEVKTREERKTTENGIADGMRRVSATAVSHASGHAQQAPCTPTRTLSVSAAINFPVRTSSLKPLRSLEPSPSLRLHNGVAARASQNSTISSPAEIARHAVYHANHSHSHPPAASASHTQPAQSPIHTGRATVVGIPRWSSARSPSAVRSELIPASHGHPTRDVVHVPRVLASHDHPHRTPAGSPPTAGFDDLYDVTPPGTPVRPARRQTGAPTTVPASPTRGANTTAAGVAIRDASNAANMFRNAPRLPSGVSRFAVDNRSPELPVPGAWPRYEEREAEEMREGVGEEAGEVAEEEEHVLSTPGQYDYLYKM